MEIAAASLQFVAATAQTAKGCVAAIDFFETAQNMGSDGDYLRTALEVEKYRLVSWAKRVGVLGIKSRDTLAWNMASSILAQLYALLTSAETLRNRYSLHVEEEEIKVAEDMRWLTQPKRGIPGLLMKLKPNLYTAAAKIIQEQNSSIKRLRWAARDKAQLTSYLEKIRSHVDGLNHLLKESEQQEEKAAHDQTIRQLISMARTPGETSEVKGLVEHGGSYQVHLRDAANEKQVRLVLGAHRRKDEVAPDATSEMACVDIPKLSILGRSLKPWKVKNDNSMPLFIFNLEFAMYREKQVLIQWKVVDRSQWNFYVKQMKTLAVFLTSLSTADKSFRSLPCLGYYPLQDRCRHGIVYSMADQPRSSDHLEDQTNNHPPINWGYKTLRSLISTQPFVSLKRRLELAHCLAETVQQLHTSGWLHKGLRPENILFVARRGSSDEDFLSSEPYVAGYDYSRTDTIEAQKYTHLPDTELEGDIYRHPGARGHGREIYQKRFDMYSLGCIIVELVMWQPLLDTFAEFLPGKKNLKELVVDAERCDQVMELPGLKELLDQEMAVRKFQQLAGEVVLEVVRIYFGMERKSLDDEGYLTEQIRWWSC